MPPAAFAAHRSRTRRERFAVHRHTAVALEPRGLMAEWDATSGRMTLHGATKVPVPQPPDSRAPSRSQGRGRHADRERCRRRVRRARRVLSGGFPDPVCGAPHRPSGSLDRGPAREFVRHQSRARSRVRDRDRVRRRRDDRRAARTRRRRYRRLYPHRGRDARAQHHPDLLGAVPHSAYRSDACRCGSPTRRRSARIAGRVATRPISAASACST